MKESLIAFSIILLYLVLSIWQGRKACKSSRHCLIGIWLSIVSPFGIVIGLGGELLHILISCLSVPLFIIGLVLVVKNRKYIWDWLSF